MCVCVCVCVEGRIEGQESDPCSLEPSRENLLRRGRRGGEKKGGTGKEEEPERRIPHKHTLIHHTTTSSHPLFTYSPSDERITLASVRPSPC